jgi:hypothetical protein
MYPTHRYYLEQQERRNSIKECTGCNKRSVDLIYSYKYYNCKYMCSECWNKYLNYKYKKWYLH